MNGRHIFLSATLVVGSCLGLSSWARAATTVPTDVQQPGTQPGEVSAPEAPTRCGNCHGGYDTAVEPTHNWRGSMMAQAGRDPLFWATLAIAEQDFDGSGDLCIRCHSPDGWLSGRSVPTDGSALTDGDGYGIPCDMCHTLTNPDRSEHLGVQNAPFLANDGSEGYYGGGQYVIWSNSDKLGPYADAAARHQSMQSRFHREAELCGTCHDVSNPVTGDLAHNNGARIPLAPGTFSGVPGSPVAGKAAFNNPPYKYGVVERTYSEFVASALYTTRISDYPDLPGELQDGALAAAYNAAVAGTGSGDYEDGTPRFFTCQTCHIGPVTGQGCNKNPAVRGDLPRHDLTGGNYWTSAAIEYLDDRDLLLLNGGISADERLALADGRARARANLERAAALSLVGDEVRVVNLTGHKLISGYPEGRRMWLNIAWYDAGGALLREDGAYGDLFVSIDGVPTTVRSILDLSGANTRIYELHGALTQEWAGQLTALGIDGAMPVSFDRQTGQAEATLADVAAQPAGSYHETFHFVLNNHVAQDNRIPPYGMSYDEAARRNALPVPASQFGAPGPGGEYEHWDTLTLSPPAAATYATIDLLYQPTSWEYIQFLYLANDESNAFLGRTGADLLDAWMNTGMAEPHVMASAEWGTPPACVPSGPVETLCGDNLDGDCDGAIDCQDSDCAGDPACSAATCGDGICQVGEDCNTCASDCSGVLGGPKADRYCCGNGVIETAEGDGSICDGNY